MNSEKQPPKSSWLSALWAESLRALSLGWDMAIPIFGGVLIGQFLDRKLGTVHIFTIGLLFFGISISYYNLWKFIQKVKKIDDKKKQDAEHEKAKKEEKQVKK